MGNVGCKERSDVFNFVIDKMIKKIRDLCRQFCKVVMDYVLDFFLEINVLFLVLIEVVKNGNEKEVKEYV